MIREIGTGETVDVNGITFTNTVIMADLQKGTVASSARFAWRWLAIGVVVEFKRAGDPSVYPGSAIIGDDEQAVHALVRPTDGGRTLYVSTQRHDFEITPEITKGMFGRTRVTRTTIGVPPDLGFRAEQVIKVREDGSGRGATVRHESFCTAFGVNVG